MDWFAQRQDPDRDGCLQVSVFPTQAGANAQVTVWLNTNPGCQAYMWCRDTETSGGILEIGTNEEHEVVVNLDKDRTGHIVFSQAQARHLANTLLKMADRAFQESRRN